MNWRDDDPPLIPQLDVPDHEPKKTGLVDKYGKPIRRPPNPMGFHKPSGRL
jgi:hypothetical protein